jgi:hypothetical protein
MPGVQVRIVVPPVKIGGSTPSKNPVAQQVMMIVPG